MDDKFQSLKEREKELESANLYANTSMLEFLKEMKKLGKIIVLCSDMYHCGEFIEDLLKKNHIEYDRLYLSSSLQRAKADCSLYEFMIDDLGVRAEEILHIGDNYEADYENALKVGLKAFYQKAPVKEFLEHFDKIKLFYEQNQNFCASIIVGLLLRKWLENGKKLQNYWEIFGYFYAGALCYGLGKFAFDEAVKEDLHEFIFIARDGYVIQKIFDFLAKTYKKDIKTAYVYAPRSINLAINLDFENEVPWDSKTSSLIDLYADKIEAFRGVDLNAMSEDEKLKLIKENKEALNKLSLKLKQNYQNYINHFHFKEKKIGLFDIATYEFSAVKLMQKFLPDTTILSYYEHIVPNEKFKDKFKNKRKENT